MFDIIIVGGGASGLVSAISILKNNDKKKIAIIEKNNFVGKKIYATGNGKCNLTNINCKEAKKTVAFFNSLGLMVVEKEEGRIYPYSEKAKDVVRIFEKHIEDERISIYLNTEAKSIDKKNGEFIIKAFDRVRNKEVEFISQSIIIATGGKASPAYGTTGDGYALAKTLGHSVTSLVPALVGIECEEDFSDIKGVRANVEMNLLKEHEKICREKGQVHFADYGLSGIVSFNMSRYIGKDFNKYTVLLDFFPEFTKEKMLQLLNERKKIEKFSTKDFMLSLVDEKLANKIIKDLPNDSSHLISEISEETVLIILEKLKNMKFKIKGLRGWKEAQITRGGIPITEINLQSMESRIVKNLYFTGEILDKEGPCGGYNLQIAWETAMKAGENIGK